METLHAVTIKESLEEFDEVTPDVCVTDPSLEETTSAVEMREEEGRYGIGVANQDQLHSGCEDQRTSSSKCGGPDPSSMMSVQSRTGYVASDPLNDKFILKINQARRIWILPGTQIKIMMNVYTTLKGVSDLYAEDVEGQMAVLPEVPVTTEDIWKFQHLLIGKGNALPPAARGDVFDIDVGGARPIALKEKLADLIKGLLSAKMINYSRSPWPSPIVVIIKKNGVDIRSTALQGRPGQWGALLSPWTLEITKCVKGEGEIVGALAASITPRSEVDKALISIAPKKKEPTRKIQAPISIIGRDEDL
ncbi:reverse transcriptase [Phytophthora megakarya]|uniref:Reverse transcriptase n=1 Tax=Phytophthora megakarya TaxID=4795 RepID=A0A225UW15_9STRA|nr:reverse transcriptase [Phytophthora megakarya]